MVISDEYKFPRVLPVDPFRKRRRVEEVDPVPAVARIGAFRREWNRNRGGEQQSAPRPRNLNAEQEQEVRRQVRHANRKFEEQGIFLRLVLSRREDGFHLDVYDCTDNTMCQLAADLVITLDELPTLLRNLEDEAGLLVDTRT
ncbi:hypothetical protein [Desulfurivibrio alkaliphilus]|uniref:Uncharacterized protein n=1 Tax=Desulfurivibrio alkaliphilus (strain DSM 19089 / UNIQEM U267 / AHT2) TaxID=589865 RepID=D6Z6X4_DESAT|nr:hypothetical protein [Desulfurivibrio alkaliphilus]ADH86961.1 hypothetical protein DaAHT2_2296 [Desulfurivibrio alkaliphilus AHT 2]